MACVLLGHRNDNLWMTDGEGGIFSYQRFFTFYDRNSTDWVQKLPHDGISEENKKLQSQIFFLWGQNFNTPEDSLSIEYHFYDLRGMENNYFCKRKNAFCSSEHVKTGFC